MVNGNDHCGKTAAQTPDAHPGRTNEHGSIKHALMMLLCCVLPMVVLFVLFASGIAIYTSSLILIVCPIMMLFMVLFMFVLPRLTKKGGARNGGCH